MTNTSKDKVAQRFERWLQKVGKLDSTDAYKAVALEAFRAGYAARDAVLSGTRRAR